LFAIDHQYLRSVARRSLGPTLAMIGMALLAVVAVVALAPPRYSATASVYVEQLEAAPGTDQTEFLNSQFAILRSDDVVMRAVESEDFARDTRFFAAFGSRLSGASPSARRRDAAQRIGQSLMVEGEDAQGVIKVGVMSTNAHMSAKIANALARTYVESDDLRELDPRSRALRQSLARQLRSAQAELSASQRKLERQLQIGQPGGDPPIAADSLDQALAAYDSYRRSEDLEREVDINRARYESLQDQSNELEAKVLSTDAVLIEAARPARRPEAPDLAIPLLAALASGLAMAASFILLRAVSGDRLSHPSDVETKLGLPLLGLFPPGWNSQKAAACASLVANLEFAGAGSCPRSLVIASARPGEGAVFVAHAIAECLGRKGAKVLLIDAYREHSGRHGRQPGTSAGAPTSPFGNAGLDRLVTQDMTGLSAMQSDRERLSRIVEQATSRFDAVIVNAPPVLASRAAAAWAGACDGTMLLVGTSGIRRGAVSRTYRCKRLIGASMLGVVLTGFDIRVPSGSVSSSRVTAWRSRHQTAFPSHYESI